MVPQRALPFRLIAVIGLNESEFPRRDSGSQHDPIRLHPRPGDRSVLIDDRYLFLETLMAARDRLHLSYVSENASNGKPMNPSAPLFELDRLLRQRLQLVDEQQRPVTPWAVDHPLQPFDPRYFAGTEHPALFTYHRGFELTAGADPAPAPASASAKTAAASPPAADNASRSAEPGAQASPVPLNMLLRWLRSPATELLRDRLHSRLDGVDVDQLPDHEPLVAERGARNPLWRALLQSALSQGRSPPEQADARLLAEGRLPAGEIGQAFYSKQWAIADALWQASRQRLPLDAADTRWLSLNIDYHNEFGGTRGQLDQLLEQGDALAGRLAGGTQESRSLVGAIAPACALAAAGRARGRRAMAAAGWTDRSRRIAPIGRRPQFTGRTGRLSQPATTPGATQRADAFAEPLSTGRKPAAQLLSEDRQGANRRPTG